MRVILMRIRKNLYLDIATPHSHHYEHAKLCIAAGKNMLVEKAFTANTAQAEEILALAKEKGVLITEAIWTRYMPSRQMIMDLIDSGIIGEVTMLSANLCYPIENVERMRNPALAGGTLLDLGVYPINFASMVFGDDIEEITGYCVKIDTGMDAQETITIRYKDGKVANIFSSMLVAADRSGMIYGKKGYIQVQNINNPEMIRVYDVDHKLVKEIPVPEQINGYEYEVIACKKALDEGKLECPEMPHAETIQIMNYMDTLRALWGIKYPFE